MIEKRDVGYVTSRGECPLTRTGFKPSVKACKERGCKELTEEDYGGVRRMICGINTRIPGNLGKCPKEVMG